MDSETWQNCYADAVEEGPYRYHPVRGFRVQVNSTEFQRASTASLYELLTYREPPPLLRKDGRPKVHQPPKREDKSAAFYAAQELHHGLPASDTKEASKKALLQAIEAAPNRNLVVPANLTKLEQDLAAKYKVANKAARIRKEEDDKQFELRQLERLADHAEESGEQQIVDFVKKLPSKAVVRSRVKPFLDVS
jgi:hypothetical protein